MNQHNITVKRIYDPPSEDDGVRILVDRLWPRGISKERARVDLWIKAISPTNELRKWYQHDPEKWEEFQQRYLLELSRVEDDLNTLVEIVRADKVTLLYSSKETEMNNAMALKLHLDRTID